MCSVVEKRIVFEPIMSEQLSIFREKKNEPRVVLVGMVE